jgi:hypothetical protein
MKLESKIPLIYHKILPEILDIDFPEEKIATCVNCTLCRSEKSPFKEIKCCVYYPFMANFMLGGLLLDKDISLQKGQEIVRKLISEKSGVTPYGILPPKLYVKGTHEVLNSRRMFPTRTNVEAQKCAYLHEGTCSVWKYREHLCVSFFCVSIGGKYGKDFWSKVDELLNLMEQKISKHILKELNFPDILKNDKTIKPSNFDFENEEGIVLKEKYDDLWADWKGKEELFYMESYKLFSKLTEVDLNKILGPKLGELQSEIKLNSDLFLKNSYADYMILNSDLNIKVGKSKTTLSIEKKIVKFENHLLLFIKLFNGENSTLDIFDKANKLYLEIGSIIDELIEKGFLLEFQKTLRKL